MKYLKYLLFFTLLVANLNCSKDDKASEENGINTSGNKKSTGSSARGFLAADKYQSLVVEVSYVENFRPNVQTLINLKQFLETLANKPNGITIVEKQIPTPNKSVFSINDITEIENANRSKYNDTGILAVHILYINGISDSDTSSSKTLGSAYFNTSIVIYEQNIKDLSDELNEPNRVDLETTVLFHEFGHLLGLVDLGSPMQNNHLDTEHDKHCNNESCLMFWKVENSGVLQMMTSGNVPQFDANCLLDLKANGGK